MKVKILLKENNEKEWYKVEAKTPMKLLFEHIDDGYFYYINRNRRYEFELYDDGRYDKSAVVYCINRKTDEMFWSASTSVNLETVEDPRTGDKIRPDRVIDVVRGAKYNFDDEGQYGG